ncbi:MAG: YraN family protein [Legionella sp.]
MSIQLGYAAEIQAQQYLQSQGLQWLVSNYRTRVGEIDLIMRDGEYLVFVEVRARHSSTFGHALESISPRKQQKIVRAALMYLTTNKLYARQLIRFDVVTIQGTYSVIQWIKNAFANDF